MVESVYHTAATITLFQSILKHHSKDWALANIDIDHDQYISKQPLHLSSRTNATIITTDDEALRRRKEKLVMSHSNDDEVPILRGMVITPRGILMEQRCKLPKSQSCNIRLSVKIET